MAFGSRNSVLSLFLGIGVALAVVGAAAGGVIIVLLLGNTGINFYESHPFWFTYDIMPFGEAVNAVGALLLFILGAGAFYFFRGFFKRIGQAEVFFFSLFIFSFVPEALRFLILALQMLAVPPLAGIILSRVIYGCRVFGLVCIFFGSLYALDFQYQKFEIIVAVALGFAFLLTFAIPFDSQLLLTSGLYKLSDEQGLFLIHYGLILLLTVNYAISAFRGRTWWVPLGVILLLGARELLSFTLSPLTLTAGILAGLGGVIAAYKGFESTYSLT